MERFDTLADAILESRPESKEYDVYGYDSEFGLWRVCSWTLRSW